MNLMINNLALICVDSFRTKAYLSTLKKYELLPNIIFLLKPLKRNIKLKNQKYFNTSLNIVNFAKRYNIKLIKLETSDINNPCVIRQLKKTKHDLIIYSGIGGQILKKRP